MNTLKYWLRLSRLFFHYRKHSQNLPYFPIRLWVELTSHCNYRCIMCPNKDLGKEDKGYMELDLFEKIIDEAKTAAFDVNLAHRGESLLHPQLIEMIQYTKKAGLFTRLHTNGSILTKELSQQIIDSRLDRLSISFDGYNQETYEEIRRGGDFNKTITNIIQLLKIKKERQSKYPEVAIEVINFKNLSDSELSNAQKTFVQHFNGLPLNDFITKELHNWAGEFEKETDPGKYSICPFPWNALVVFWEGDVLACTQDFFGHYVLGNVKESSLKAIWNGKKMQHLRIQLARQELDELKTCSHCDRIWRKGVFGVPKEYLWKFITKKMP